MIIAYDADNNRHRLLLNGWDCADWEDDDGTLVVTFGHAEELRILLATLVSYLEGE